MLNGPIARVGYQDDNYLVGSADVQQRGWQQMEVALAQDGHRLRRAKCKIWVPGLDALSNDVLPSSSVGLTRLVPRSQGGLKMLGTAAQGELETYLGPSYMALEPARERAHRAMNLLSRVQ
eukprot:950180-Karenia_brevis.AAC.1